MKFRALVFTVSLLTYKIRWVFGVIAALAFISLLGQTGTADIGGSVDYIVIIRSGVIFAVCGWLAQRQAPEMLDDVYRYFHNSQSERQRGEEHSRTAR